MFELILVLGEVFYTSAIFHITAHVLIERHYYPFFHIVFSLFILGVIFFSHSMLLLSLLLCLLCLLGVFFVLTPLRNKKAWLALNRHIDKPACDKIESFCQYLCRIKCKETNSETVTLKGFTTIFLFR